MRMCAPPRLSRPNPSVQNAPAVRHDSCISRHGVTQRAGRVSAAAPPPSPPPAGVSVFAPTFHCPGRDANRGSKALVALATPVQPRIFCVRRISLCAFRHRFPVSLYHPKKNKQTKRIYIYIYNLFFLSNVLG